VLLLLIAMLADQGSPIKEVVDYFALPRKSRPSTSPLPHVAWPKATTGEDPAWAQGFITGLAQDIADYAGRSANQTMQHSSAPASTPSRRSPTDGGAEGGQADHSTTSGNRKRYRSA